MIQPPTWRPGDRPLVSHPVLVIGIPAFNEERFLQRTIDSLKAQTWSDFMVLIADNASTDRTGGIGQQATQDDDRFFYHRHSANIGGSGNFNFLKDATSSPLFMWMGAHDMIAPTFLAKTLPTMLNDPSVSVGYCHTGWIDDAGTITHVTTSPGMESLPNQPVARFLLTTRRIEWCTEINTVLRRDFLRGYEYENVFGTDLIGLAHLAYHGPFHCVPEPLYLRWRRVDDEPETYMERLTGASGVGWDMDAFVETADRQLVALEKRGPLLRVARPLVRTQLRHRFGLPDQGLLGRMMRGLAALKRWGRALRPPSMAARS